MTEAAKDKSINMGALGKGLEAFKRQMGSEDVYTKAEIDNRLPRRLTAEAVTSGTTVTRITGGTLAASWANVEAGDRIVLMSGGAETGETLLVLTTYVNTSSMGRKGLKVTHNSTDSKYYAMAMVGGQINVTVVAS